jgi:predicted ATP-dependent endonuclease of OLD family
MLIREFVKSAQLCKRGMPAKRWKKALSTLESDPIFRAAEVEALTEMDRNEDDFNEEAENLFKRLSSGHKIVLLTITRLVETVEEQTLVLLDEPEGHLHPPLLAAFVRALTDLMIDRNGVAIVATHSPVVLQEIPKTCVWTLQRTGKIVRAERPEVETFGENVGVLTREVFGYEVTESGFHKMLYEAAKEEPDFDDAVERFHGELGAEARAILRGLFAADNSVKRG